MSRRKIKDRILTALIGFSALLSVTILVGTSGILFTGESLPFCSDFLEMYFSERCWVWDIPCLRALLHGC